MLASHFCVAVHCFTIFWWVFLLRMCYWKLVEIHLKIFVPIWVYQIHAMI